jgi:glycosyltransferase involved in cell wall biosynthesis
MIPTISVVIPTRNRPALLTETLASVAGQRGLDLADIEVVVVNDGGTSVDTEVRAAREHGLQVRHFDLPERRGLPVARNTGIDHTTGEFLAFVDDDDVFLPDHLCSALEVLNSDTDLVYGDCLVSSSRVDPAGPVSTPLAFDFPFDPNLLHVANIIPVHSAVLRTVRDLPARFDPALPALEDWDLWLRLQREHRYRFQHLDQATVIYHRIPARESMTGQTTTEAAALAGFGDLLRGLWQRWHPTNTKVTRFRGWVGIMYWHAFAEFARGRVPDFNYYLRSLHVLADAWTGRVAESELTERLAQAVIAEETANATAA